MNVRCCRQHRQRRTWLRLLSLLFHCPPPASFISFLPPITFTPALGKYSDEKSVDKGIAVLFRNIHMPDYCVYQFVKFRPYKQQICCGAHGVSSGRQLCNHRLDVPVSTEEPVITDNLQYDMEQPCRIFRVLPPHLRFQFFILGREQIAFCRDDTIHQCYCDVDGSFRFLTIQVCSVLFSICLDNAMIIFKLVCPGKKRFSCSHSPHFPFHRIINPVFMIYRT